MTPHGKSINWHKMDIASDFLEIFHAILKGDINSRSKLDTAFKHLEWKEIELVKGVEPIVIRFLEFCFFIAGSVTAPIFEDCKTVIKHLIQWFPELKQLLEETGADALGNIVLEARGRIKFHIKDSKELDKLITAWEDMGLAKITKEEIFLAIINKPTIQQKILQSNIKIKILLNKYFPEIAKTFPLLLISEEERKAYTLFKSLQRERYTDKELEDINRLIEQENQFAQFYIGRNYRLSFLIKRKHSFQCQICKALKKYGLIQKNDPNTNDKNSIEAHHVIPLENGGEDVSSNIIIVCNEHHHALHNAKIVLCDMKDKWLCRLENGHEVILEKN